MPGKTQRIRPVFGDVAPVRGIPAPTNGRNATCLPAWLVPVAARSVVHESSAMLGLGARLVDREVASRELASIQLGDGFRRLLVRAHFHEREPARAAGGHVFHDLHGLDGARLLEQFLKLCRFGVVREISDIKFPTHLFTPALDYSGAAPRLCSGLGRFAAHMCPQSTMDPDRNSFRS